MLETRSSNTQPACKLPRFLRPLIRWGRRDLSNRNAVLSILNVHRLVILRPVGDLRSIRGEFTGKWPNGGSLRILKKACFSFAREHPKGDLMNKEFSWAISWAAGPNGKPAWDKVLEDFIAVHSTYLGHYVSYFLEVFPLKCGEQIKSDLRILRDYLRNWTPTAVDARESKSEVIKAQVRTRTPDIGKVLNERKSLAKRLETLKFYGFDKIPFDGRSIATALFKEPFCFERGMKILAGLPHASRPELYDHSRLHFLADKAGKTRVIALGDVLTQTLCIPLEKEIFRRLRLTPTDGTFDQDKQRVRVREATRQNIYCFSIDMKSCTDRLPALFQALCLRYSGLLNGEQSLA